MRKQKNLIIIVILTIISTVLTFFAPLVKESTEGVFKTYTDTITLFEGVEPEIFVALTVIAGICFVLSACIGLFGDVGDKGIIGARFSGIALLIMQAFCIIQLMIYYDGGSVLGAVRREISQMSVHPVAVITMIITLTAVIMCFSADSDVSDDSQSKNGTSAEPRV